MSTPNPIMTPAEVQALDLFDDILDAAEADADEAVAIVVAEARDSRRRFRGTVRAAIRTRDGGVCRYCGEVVEPGTEHIDHIIPWSRGGQTHPLNAALAHPRCNLAKRDRVW